MLQLVVTQHMDMMLDGTNEADAPTTSTTTGDQATVNAKKKDSYEAFATQSEHLQLLERL